MDSFLVLASYIPPWQKRSRIKIRISRFIMSEKRLISSILIRLILHKRIGWRGLFGVPIDHGRLPQNSRKSLYLFCVYFHRIESHDFIDFILGSCRAL